MLFKKKGALSAMGMVSPSQMRTSEQATMVGNIMSAAHSAARKGQDVAAAIEMERAKSEHQAAIRAGAIMAMQELGFHSKEIDNPATVAVAAAAYGQKAQDLQDSIFRFINRDRHMKVFSNFLSMDFIYFNIWETKWCETICYSIAYS